MAESVVSFVIERLGDLLIQEAFFLHGVREQVVRLQNELKRMQCFLKDADAKQGDERVRNWVSEIRDAAYDAEDVIETFILRAASTRRQGFIGLMKNLACVFNQGIALHKLGNEIEAIQTRIHDISNSRETYSIKDVREGEGTSSTSDRMRQLRRSSSHAVDEDIIGLEDEAKMLVTRLVKKELRRCVISIVGMGGMGKTTLAKKVYNCIDVKNHFNCRAWVYASKEYRTKDILQGIIKAVIKPSKEELEMMEKLREDELERKLYDHLQESDRRYLVVIDDIWSKEAWDSLKSALPNKTNGSRVLLTTRNRDVALYADAQSLHELRFLREEESWELFCKKAFSEDVEAIRPPNLEKFGKEMVERCGGLPLAIIVLGGLVSRKKLPNQWERVLNNISRHLIKDQSRISEILALSYNDLSYHLRMCFLYLGLFPEDVPISTKKLMKLWIAEGFIPQGEETMEDIAEDYLNELIERSMIQVAKRTSGGDLKECIVHDLLRDLSVSKAKEENFLGTHGSSNSSSSSKLRRYAIHSAFNRYVSNSQHHPTPHLRSLLFFNLEDSPVSIEKLRFIYKDFRLLRVLDLEGTHIISLPKQIGKLIHLRYLGLSWTKLEELPPSIGNLRNLQTLDLGGNENLHTLPNVICKMEQLRYLNLLSHVIRGRIRIGTLRNLRSLTHIQAGSWTDEDFTNLTNLRNLGIHSITSSHTELVSNFIVKLDYLQALTLSTIDEDPLSTRIALSRCQHLFKLYLYGRLVKLPEFPPNLTKLTLSESHLEQDPMATLENLPYLIFLSLKYQSYMGKNLVCSANGFLQLDHLEVRGLDQLEEWRVEEGAMPKLRSLLIDGCTELKRVPEGLRFVTTLRELEIRYMPREFEDTFRGEVGHINTVRVR